MVRDAPGTGCATRAPTARERRSPELRLNGEVCGRDELAQAGKIPNACAIRAVCLVRVG